MTKGPEISPKILPTFSSGVQYFIFAALQISSSSRGLVTFGHLPPQVLASYGKKIL
jgi:hypothetical protein